MRGSIQILLPLSLSITFAPALAGRGWHPPVNIQREGEGTMIERLSRDGIVLEGNENADHWHITDVSTLSLVEKCRALYSTASVCDEITELPSQDQDDFFVFIANLSFRGMLHSKTSLKNSFIQIRDFLAALRADLQRVEEIKSDWIETTTTKLYSPPFPQIKLITEKGRKYRAMYQAEQGIIQSLRNLDLASALKHQHKWSTHAMRLHEILKPTFDPPIDFPSHHPLASMRNLFRMNLTLN